MFICEEKRERVEERVIQHTVKSFTYEIGKSERIKRDEV